jgi:hypothetical protein
MKCMHCRRTISKVDSKKAVPVRDGAKLKGMLHFKCNHILTRKERLGSLGRDSAPTAYEMSAERKTADDYTVDAIARAERAESELARLKTLRGRQVEFIEAENGKVSIDDLIHDEEQALALAQRQAQIAEETEKEPRREQWDDVRDPSSVEF